MNTLLDTTDKTPAQYAADRLKAAPFLQFNSLFNAWRTGVSSIWDAENPQDVLDAVGNSGGELFALAGATAGFLESLKPGCTAETVAKIKAFSIADDGRVTITIADVAPEVTDAPAPDEALAIV